VPVNSQLIAELISKSLDAMEPLFYAIIFISLFFTLIVVYLIHLNTKMSGTPEEALTISPNRWTVDEIRETHQRISEKPIDSTPHLPPKLGRRYIVTGSSGKCGFQHVPINRTMQSDVCGHM